MPSGVEQYDQSWLEQDKMRRRREIKDRLKQEMIRQRWDPFKHMQKIPETDPAIDRYMDLRKKGRMPGAPLKPTLFFGSLAMIFVPMITLSYLMSWERNVYLAKCEAGLVPFRDKWNK